MFRSTVTAICLGLALGATPAAAYDDAYLAGVTPYIDTHDRLVFDGARVIGGGLTLKDAVKLVYSFDPHSLDFTLAGKKIYRNIGVFNETHMAKNVEVIQPTYVAEGRTYKSGETYNFQTGARGITLTFQLKVGHVMSWLIKYPSGEYRMTWSGPSGAGTFVGAAYNGVISSAYRILQDGKYTLTIRPTASQPLSFSLLTYNANNRLLQPAVDGSYLSASFLSNIRDYAKYSVHLKRGQMLHVGSPSSSDICLKLVDRYGTATAEVCGLPLIFKAESTGDYVLFIDNRKGWGGSYSGTVSITNATGGQSEVVAAASPVGADLRPMEVTPAQ